MFNHNTRHLSGQQRYVVDKKINDEKKRQEEAEKAAKLEKQAKLKEKKENVTLDIFQEIKNELESFMVKNPNVKPEIVINPEVFEEIKRISPESTYKEGKSTTIFGADFSVEETEEYFSVRKLKKK